jgi:hypothetical protein
MPPIPPMPPMHRRGRQGAEQGRAGGCDQLVQHACLLVRITLAEHLPDHLREGRRLVRAQRLRHALCELFARHFLGTRSKSCDRRGSVGAEAPPMYCCNRFPKSKAMVFSCINDKVKVEGRAFDCPTRYGIERRSR